MGRPQRGLKLPHSRAEPESPLTASPRFSPLLCTPIIRALPLLTPFQNKDAQSQQCREEEKNKAQGQAPWQGKQTEELARLSVPLASVSCHLFFTSLLAWWSTCLFQCVVINPLICSTISESFQLP